MKALLRDLGTLEYAACWKLQQEFFDALLARKRSGSRECGERVAAECASEAKTADESTSAGRASDTNTDAGGTFGPMLAADCARLADPHGRELAGEVLLVEHTPVYTLGKSGHAENLLVSREALEAAGAGFFHIDRGGDITFHGPGQLVGYPILDLECLGIGLRDYIDALEEAVIRTVDRYGIRGGRIHGASGVWIDAEGRRPRKICAIGVRSSRYVTMHGFALNVTTDLSWFSRINPCGFTDRGVTSIASETGSTPSMEEVKRLVVKFLSEELNVEIYK
uniref:lipoyl(octanoyl) transferase LipB n=1 Tax=Alistipes megaguti TaxID=2364787 RepID=UPI003744761A